MAEETQNEQVDTPVEESGAAAQGPKFNEIEQRALEQGWRPESEYDGPGKWRDAEEFLDRGELFHKIEEQKKHAKQLEFTVQELKKHYKGIRETEYRRALNALKLQKREAMDEGDNGRVVEIDEQIAATKVEAGQALRQLDQPVANVDNTSTHPAFLIWQNRNSWYASKPAMRAYADEIGTQLAMRGMNNPVEILQEVERRVRKEFSNEFTNPNRDKPGSVEGSGNRSGRKADSFELTADERKVMNRFVKQGVLTEAEYIRDIKEQRGV